MLLFCQANWYKNSESFMKRLAMLSTVTFAAWACITATAVAQPSESNGWSVRASFDNDLFAGTDQYYTNGIRLDLVSPPDEMPWIGRQARDRIGYLFADTNADTWYTTFSFNQEMYTPQDLTLRMPDPDDRPYAGYLHASLGLAAESDRALRTLALDFGVVGRMAQADDAQRLVHDTIAGDDPVGWSHQLRNEPGVRLIYEHRGRYNDLTDLGLLGLKLDYSTGYGGSLGNVNTSVSAGATLRISDGTTSRFGPDRIHPVVAAPALWDTSTFDWYVFAGIEGRAVARDIFLEGNTFRNSRNVEAHRLVADMQMGFAMKYKALEVAYTHIVRTPEFRGQRGTSQFGRLAISVNF